MSMLGGWLLSSALMGLGAVPHVDKPRLSFSGWARFDCPWESLKHLGCERADHTYLVSAKDEMAGRKTNTK